MVCARVFIFLIKQALPGPSMRASASAALFADPTIAEYKRSRSVMRAPEGTDSRPPPTSSCLRIVPRDSHLVGVDVNVSAVMSLVKLAGIHGFAGSCAYSVFPEAISMTSRDAYVEV